MTQICAKEEGSEVERKGIAWYNRNTKNVMTQKEVGKYAGQGVQGA